MQMNAMISMIAASKFDVMLVVTSADLDFHHFRHHYYQPIQRNQHHFSIDRWANLVSRFFPNSLNSL